MTVQKRVAARAAVCMVTAAGVLGGCAHTSAPAAPATADLEPRLTLLRVDDRSPDVRLTLNQNAYVTLIMIDPSGTARLLNQRGSATSKHFGEGVHLLRSRDIHGPTNRPIRITPLTGQEVRNFRDSPDLMYMAIATSGPLNLRQAVEGRECDLSGTDHAALAEDLRACLLGDEEMETGIAMARWPTELIEGFR